MMMKNIVMCHQTNKSALTFMSMKDLLASQFIHTKKKLMKISFTKWLAMIAGQKTMVQFYSLGFGAETMVMVNGSLLSVAEDNTH